MKFQFFQNFTKKKIEIIKMFLHFWFFTCLQLFSFRTSLFIKRSHVSLHSYSMFKHVNFGKHIWMHTSKTLKKNILILKFYHGTKCLHVSISFFHPEMKFHPLSFWQGWVHPATKFQKNILILKFYHGTKCLLVFISFFHPLMKFHPLSFDRDEFIPRRNFISA